MKALSLAALVFSLPTEPVFADQTSSSHTGGDAVLYMDNDVFGGEDRDYTSGLRYAWTSDPFDSKSSDLADSMMLLGKITGFENPENAKYSWGFSLTQLIYTPEDHDTPTQPVGERQYAGWLGLGFSLHAQESDVLNSVEFTLGTTGPNSLAEASQDFIHDLAHINHYQGWDSQIPNEITADLAFVQKRRGDFESLSTGSFSMDRLLEWGLRLGTFRTSAHVGGSIRGGFNLRPDFSSARLSGTAYSHRDFDSAKTTSCWSPYFIVGTSFRGVAHDSTLDGPLFRDFDTDIKREPFVAEGFFGIGLRYRDAELSYIHTLTSEEYKEQGGYANFGTIALKWSF